MASALRNQTAVLFSEQSRRAYAEQALRDREIYSFTAATGGERTWLKGEFAYLAPNAVSSILHRWEIKHDLVDEEALGARLDAYRTLFIPNAGHLREADTARIADWLQRPDTFLVVTGKTNLPDALLGLERRTSDRPDGYTGWQWNAGSPFADRQAWEEVYVSSYRGYECSHAAAAPHASVLADLYELSGDLSSATTATKRRLGAAIVATNQTLFVANQVFEYLGGIFQAHINVEEVRLWSNPSHWGDTLAFFLRESLRTTPARRLWQTTLRPFSTYDGVLQLRHDVDHEADASIDFSMLELQVQNAIPASYYLMDPEYCTTRCTTMGAKMWLEATSPYNFIEAAQHNDSLDGDPPRWIIGTGLHDHIQASDLTLGLHSQTAGRHMGFLVYPETIDAMDFLYDNSPDMLGLCTFSLYDVLAYGERNPDVVVHGKQLTYSTYDHSNPTVPAAIPGYWFPYHVVVSTIDEHKTLRGWDVTHDTDCDFQRLEELFVGRHSRCPDDDRRLENGVFTIQYESQLARDPRENNGHGHLPWMRYAIALSERHNFWVTTKRELYERMNDYQDVVFRVEEGVIHLHNPTARTIAGLVIQTDTPINTVADGDRHHIHIVGERLCTVPVLAPGETITLRATKEPTVLPAIRQPNSNFLTLHEASYVPETQEINVRGRAIRKGIVLVQDLPSDVPMEIWVRDNRGLVRTREQTRHDGSIAVPILGQPDNLMDVEVTIRPC